MSAEFSSTNEATTATAGQIRTYHGAPAFTQFSASSGGWTSDGGKPYLPAQKDPYDGWSGNRVHTWSTTVTSGADREGLAGAGQPDRHHASTRVTATGSGTAASSR